MPGHLPIRISEPNRRSGAAETADASTPNPDSVPDDRFSPPIAEAPAATTRSGLWNGSSRTIFYAGVVFAALLLAAVSFVIRSKPVAFENTRTAALGPAARTQLAEPRMEAVAGLRQGAAAASRSAPAPPPMPSNSQSPMIARTVSLTIFVKDFAASRSALDRVLAQVHGYPASLTVNTPETGGRSLQASLRIPATDLSSAIAGLRTLGHVLSETQSGEEVTQQHADLVARLQNSREEETRLRAILVQRTGKIEDVLQVEEAIARVRGDIESMEAEQKSLEHRVDFATVDLQLTEEYTEQLNSSAESAPARMYNALIEGLRNASGTVLGIVLFLEEFGPAILVWLVILGLPAWILWRRYRKMHATA